MHNSQVVVMTSDIRGAGTDANISIVVHGTKDGQSLDTGSHKLDDSKNNFERNMKDIFMLKTKDVGELTRVVVGVCVCHCVVPSPAGNGSHRHYSHRMLWHHLHCTLFGERGASCGTTCISFWVVRGACWLVLMPQHSIVLARDCTSTLHRQWDAATYLASAPVLSHEITSAHWRAKSSHAL